MEGKLIIIFFVTIELAYIISCINAIFQIQLNKLQHRELQPLSTSLTLMLLFGIIATILRPINADHIITKIAFHCFFIFELYNLYFLKEYSIKNKSLKLLLTLLLSVSLLYLLIISRNKYNFNLYNIFFVFESIIAGTISLLYFQQLNSKISTKNLIDDPMTYIMLALFFCFGMPLSYTSSFISFEYMNSNFLNPIRKEDALALFFISRIGTICYIVFNLFIIKAYKCKQTTLTGFQ